MTNVKRPGCCTLCDAEVFEVVRRNPETRAPIQVGRPLETAMRVTFLLQSGSQMDLTFCRACTDKLAPHDYAGIWKRVLASWIAESGKDHPGVAEQKANALLTVFRIKRWADVRS